jgi:hypothetical protein
VDLHRFVRPPLPHSSTLAVKKKTRSPDPSHPIFFAGDMLRTTARMSLVP